MATRRAVLALLAIVFATRALPAAAAPRPHGVPRVTINSEGAGTLIALRSGAARVHFLHARAALSRAACLPIARGPYFTRLVNEDEGWQGSDDGHDAAMPRAPAAVAVVPIASVRVTAPVYVRPASFRRFRGRAPPSL
jgi:hypothetical protein